MLELGLACVVRFAVRDESWAAQKGTVTSDGVSGTSGILLIVDKEDDPAETNKRLRTLCASLPDSEPPSGTSLDT